MTLTAANDKKQETNGLSLLAEPKHLIASNTSMYIRLD